MKRRLLFIVFIPYSRCKVQVKRKKTIRSRKIII